ncbi:hypothetical protein V6N12_065434 [Hibiscus sabdariffa]|uniref:Reverse transcriptase domain-containing protein n=1 Tax=Hibiscus sabdariffa TaxID=183260 RepID=A0ABR2G8Q2_9ROSI
MCPFGTFTYRCMRFGLCNAPATFQHFMVSIFSDFIEKVEQSKIDVIRSLSYPTTVGEVHSFLGHAGFYRGSLKIPQESHNRYATFSKRTKISISIRLVKIRGTL